ncbi:MAG: GDP-mannose dehydrogenase [Gemmatimonadetes bacterium]|nr:MAG: GDP-mannose dehydrogenase [Gemmatimonadota bacterium]
MRISIFGLGYVGTVSAACLARDGHHVIGVDIDANKLAMLRDGRSPIIEAGMRELVAEVVASGRVEVTDDAAAAVRESELSFVCVSTPARPNGSQDLRALERLGVEMGRALATKSTPHVIVVRSTVLPGTVDGVFAPLVERHSGRRCGDDFDICFQPEFLREGTSIRDYDAPPLTVIGAESDRPVRQLRELFGKLPCTFVVCGVRTAEMLKYVCNAFHALKISFANEIGRICQALEIDAHAVMDLVCLDTQLNISTAYLRPGFAFGGSCLPKDLRALLHAAARHDVDIPVLSGVRESNETHLHHGIDTVLATGATSVGMLGLSFKGGTDDLRDSPLVAMAEHFVGKGLKVRIYDPEVNVSRLVGANRRYIDQSIPHIGLLMCSEPGPVIDESDVLVVGLRTPAVLRELVARCRDNQVIVDLVQLPNREELRGQYRGVCW